MKEAVPSHVNSSNGFAARGHRVLYKTLAFNQHSEPHLNISSYAWNYHEIAIL